MDLVLHPTFQPHPGLQKTLKQFHLSSMSSLGGPAAFSSQWQHELFGKDLEDPAHAAVASLSATATTATHVSSRPPPVPPVPLFMVSDQSTERFETLLEGESISCFVVGGEKRLCLPQILNTVLRNFSLQQINGICDELHIYCSRCTAEQLEILKVIGILPFSAPSCGLITKTDAERLCGTLMRAGTRPLGTEESGMIVQKGFRVYHECFGKCTGIVVPELYTSPAAECIQCVECGIMHNTYKFVVHGHKCPENRTCHWGFDSANWRAYILLSTEYTEQEEKLRLENLLQELKERFDFTMRYKRRMSEIADVIPIKKMKDDELCHLYKKESQPDWLFTLSTSASKRSSAFRPWSPNITISNKDKAKPESVTCRRGFYNYKALEKIVAPNVVLPSLQKGALSHHYILNSSNRGNNHTQAYAKNRGKRITEEGNAGLSQIDHTQPGQTHKSLISSQITPSVKELHDSDLEVEAQEKAASQSSRSSPSITSSTSAKDLISPRLTAVKSASKTRMDLELETLKKVLDGGLDSRESKEKFLHEVVKMRVRQEEKLESVLKAKRNLQQELELLRLVKKEKLCEVSEARRSLRQEMERLRDESDQKIKEANKTQIQLTRELQHIKELHPCDPEPGNIRAKYSAQIEELQLNLQLAEADREQLRFELQQEREARQHLERIVNHLQDQLCPKPDQEPLPEPQKESTTVNPVSKALSITELHN